MKVFGIFDNEFSNIPYFSSKICPCVLITNVFDSKIPLTNLSAFEEQKQPILVLVTQSMVQRCKSLTSPVLSFTVPSDLVEKPTFVPY
jgi:hypothetical protein